MIPMNPSLSRPKVTASLPDGSYYDETCIGQFGGRNIAVLSLPQSALGKYLVCVESHKFSSVIYIPVIDADVGRIDKQLRLNRSYFCGDDALKGSGKTTVSSVISFFAQSLVFCMICIRCLGGFFFSAVVVSLASLLSAEGIPFSCVDSAAVVSAVVVSDGWLEQAVMLAAAMRGKSKV